MRRFRKKDHWHLIWIIPLFILLLPILIIAAPFIIIHDIKSKKKAKDFWKDHLDKVFFFYHTKKNWGNFIENNIIPILPEGITIINIYRDEPNLLRNINIIKNIGDIPWEQSRLPFIIQLKAMRPVVYSFYKDFNGVKVENAKQDQSLQESIRQKLMEKLNGY